jgi:HTH-type transcriptional regulator/antitoxin HigA
MEQIRPIKTETDYEMALAEIDKLMSIDPDKDTATADRLELLAILVEDYEEKHYPIPAPDDPVEVIIFYLEKSGLTRKDLETFIGSRARVSDVLNRKRPLSLSMIRRLSTGLGIPADLLIAPLKSSSKMSSKGAQVSTR